MHGAHHKHEDSVEDEGHGTEGLDGGHHVPLQTEREHNAQGHPKEQEHAEGATHLQRKSPQRSAVLTSLTSGVCLCGCWTRSTTSPMASRAEG